MTLLLIFVFSLTQFAVIAQDCAPMNLVTEKDSPFQQIPVHDQDGLDICYAYAASQMINYHLVKRGLPASVHPFWAALVHAEAVNKDSLGIGYAFKAMEEIQKKGNCPADRVSSLFSQWAKKSKVDEVNIMKVIELFAQKITSKDIEAKLTSQTLTEQEVEKTITEAINEQAIFCPYGATWKNLYPEIKSLGIMSSRKMVASLLTPICTPYINNLISFKPTYEQIHNDDLISPHLNSKLDKLKSPLSINYCSNVLASPQYDGLTRDLTGSRKYHESSCERHESILVGKKKINGSCHYLLRNTWGSGFSMNTENWKCLCKKKGTNEYVDDCTNRTHNNGKYVVEGCWISEEALSKNAYAITSIEDP